jgi:glycosyltransferase involved in cell wall biosynthesis
MIITNSFTGGGAERSANITANGLKALGLEVSLVAINSGPEDLVKINSDKYCLGRPWRGGIWTTAKALFELNTLVRRIRPDTILANCELPELMSALLFFKTQIIVVEHTSNPWTGRLELGRVIRRLLKIRSSKFVSVSSHLSIWPWHQMPNRVIQNPLDLDNFQPRLRPRSISSIERLVFIGRLNDAKNPRWLIEISRSANLPCMFIGEGEMRQELETASLQSDVETEFVGRVENPWEFLLPGDLLIVPSNFEGDGLVILEALIHGVPLIVHEIPDLLRFNFPSKNYSSSVEDFTRRINEFRYSLNELSIEFEFSKVLTSQRDPKIIAESWKALLMEIKDGRD